MTGIGVLMMVLSNGLVIGLMLYCLYRVLRTPGTSEHEHAPLEIDTLDRDPPSDR